MSPQSTPQDSKFNLQQSNLVKITVCGGPHYQIRQLRRDQLIKYTSFLTQHDQQRTSSPLTGYVVHEDLHTFYTFSHWLSGRRIQHLHLGQHDLMAAWMLGDKYQARNFQNILIGEMLCNWRRGTPVLPGHVKAAYKGTKDGSAVRRLVVDAWCGMILEEREEKQWKRCMEAAFWVDVHKRGIPKEGTRALRRREAYMV